ncbi:MAG: succinylglutamate desuccinylase/aspartoacylase family protein, partial [Pseudomonadota bacterium]
FLPLAAAHLLEDKTQEAACIAAMQAFCAPYSLKMLEMDAVGMLDTAVEDAGKLFVTTELGGGGTSTARSNAIAKRGLRNFLIHIGVLRGQIEHASSTLLNMPDDQCFHKSLDSGLLEPMADLGDGVLAGDLLARVWPVDRTGVQPVLYHAQRDGIVMARHFPGLIGVGDCLAVVAEIVP